METRTTIKIGTLDPHSAENSTNSTDLASIADTIDRLTKFAELIEGICNTNADRIFGPRDELCDNEAADNPCGSPSGTVRQVQHRLTYLEAQIEKAAHQARRFNSL